MSRDRVRQQAVESHRVKRSRTLETAPSPFILSSQEQGLDPFKPQIDFSGVGSIKFCNFST